MSQQPQLPETVSENGNAPKPPHVVRSEGNPFRQRLIKLISVRLKEAALDSPSFRASLNYHNHQIDQTDQWIDGLLKFGKKYAQQYSDFKEFNNVLINQLFPDFLSSGLVDQENTLSVMNTTKTNLDANWEDSLRQLDFTAKDSMEILSTLSRVHIKHYKEIKKNFEFMQSKYDSLLSKYCSQSKSKEPSASREDAFQLFEVRKLYLSASLDMCLEISKFHQVFEKSLVILADLDLKGRSIYDEEYFKKMLSWSDAVTKSVASLMDDMLRSREQIEQVTVAEFEPVRDLKQHNPALINTAKLTQYDREIDGDIDVQAQEKHGWLWMKTTVGKPSRQIWVRRWVFVKSGIFGLFSLSPSKHFVQETDKIGVLLCNIRYAPDEDRRYCFEIKTIDLTIVFQAETLRELRSWLRIFTSEKQRAIENSESESGKFAFGRYPPLLYEFANTSLTTVDVELTSSTYDNTTRDDVQFTVASSYLADLMTKTDRIDDGQPLIRGSKETSLITPIVTSRSKFALLSHEFISPTVVPTAINANIWGSVNWGLYYMSGHSLSPGPDPQHPTATGEQKMSSLHHKNLYSSSYPDHLKRQDVELRGLFNTTIEDSELLVTCFSCLWVLNPNQELSGRCFVTNKNVYFYLNSAGFVSLLKKPLPDIVAIDVFSEKYCDTLKIYDMEGLNMTGSVYLEDTKIIQKKIDYLINNLAKETPDSADEVLKKVQDLEANELRFRHEAEHKKHHSNDKLNNRFELNSIQPFQGQKLENKLLKTNFKDEFETVNVQSFEIPAKALFHMLYGDNSTVFRDSVSFLDIDDYRPTPWYEDNSQLVRYIDYKVGFSGDLVNLKGTVGNMSARIYQRIEEMVENKYYRIEDSRNSFQFLWSGTFKIRRKLIIVEQDAKSCKLFIYMDLKDDVKRRSWLYSIFKNTIKHFQLNEVRATFNTLQAYSEDLGNHGKIIKAIRTYGNLSKTDEPFQEREDFVFQFKHRIIFKYYLRVLLFEVVTAILTLFRFLLISWLQIWNALSANRFLGFLLALSVGFNLFLIGKTSVSYWHATNTELLMKRFRQGVRLDKVERSISLNELEILSNSNFNTTSLCFTNYLNSQENSYDVDALPISSKFKENKHQIALKRNELLVELKILEKVEKELTAGEYKNFLMSELNSCRLALDDLKVNDTALKSYCSDCIDEFEKATAGLL